MALSARMAIESPMLTTDIVNVSVLPYLAVRYGVDDIPTTVVNRRKVCVGVRTEDEFVREITG